MLVDGAVPGTAARHRGVADCPVRPGVTQEHRQQADMPQPQASFLFLILASILYTAPKLDIITASDRV